MFIQNNQLMLIKKSSLYLLFFSIFFFILVSFFLFLSINTQEFDIEMFIVSIFFFFFLTFIIINEEDKFTPIIFFSLLFYGYVFSGLYFSYYQNIHTAKFFNFSGNFTTQDMKISLFQVILGYIFFVTGYKIIGKLKTKKINFEIQGINYSSNLLKGILILFFLLSFFYWVYVSFRIAKGPIDLLQNMGIYSFLLENTYISTAPYLLAYMTASFLFLIHLKNRKKISIYLILMIFTSFIMYVSTARLSGSVFYLLSFPLMYIIYYKKKLNIKNYVYISLFIIFLGFLYFYRFYSNLSYLGIEIETNLLNLMGEHFFGMTNFGDLQSITFARQYTQDVGYLYGASFSDFIREWLNRIPGIEIENTSIGLRLREFYFSHVSTGAPAPGIISEMFINFGYLGLTLVMFLFGFFAKIITILIDRKNNIVNLYIYTHFLLFFMLLAKVDSSHISSLLWNIIPFYILLISVYLSSKLYERIKI